MTHLRVAVAGASGYMGAELLRILKPDVHCKGTDYTVESVPERAVVQSYGGRTAIVGDQKSHATRDLIARISRSTSD